jgi:uncharacterized ion transporter superfamily protein YfcC
MKFNIPHTFTIIFVLITIMGFLTWFLPAGKFDREYDEVSGKELLVAGTYKVINSTPQGYQGVLTSLTKGFIDAAEIIAFVVILGGTYGVILKTGAIDAALKAVIYKLKGKDNILISVLMVIFSIAGAMTGSWEETLAFYLIIVPLMVRAGYDPLVGVSIVLVGAITGVMASIVNPFATGIASAIAQTNIKDGMDIRIAYWFVAVITSITYVLFYANRIKADPTKSLLYKEKDVYLAAFLKQDQNISETVFTKRKKIVITAFISSIIVMFYGIIVLEWWIPEMTMCFLTGAIISAIVMKMKERDFWECFIEGAKEFLSAALVIAFARGIMIVAQDGNILDSILYYASVALSSFSGVAFVILSEIVQTAIAFFVPSSSAQAALTISLMAPLGDLFEIPRHVAVNVLQVSSSLANMLTPTSGVLMAAIAIGKVPYGTWIRFIFPLFVIHFILSIGFLIISIYM